jgi:hypothetical protein
MPLQNIPLLKSDFDICDWQQVIAQCDQKECRLYSRLFFEQAGKAEEAANTKAQEIFALLGGIASLNFTLDNKEAPFAPAVVWKDGSRSFIVDDLTDEHLKVLTEVIPQVTDPEMRARMTDVLWVKARNFRMACLAVDAYLASATALEKAEQWVQAVQRVERALQLAATLGKNNQYFPKTIQYIENFLDSYEGKVPLFFSVELMELLLAQRQGEPVKYAKLAELGAMQAEAEKNWHIARKYWEIWGKWLALTKDSDRKYASLEAIAETFVKEANEAAKVKPPRYMAVAMHMQSAIETLRKVPGMQARTKELHLLLLDYQEKIEINMGTISVPFDVTEFQERARELVKGKTLPQALQALAFIGSFPRVDTLRELVVASLKQFPFRSLASVVAINDSGKTVGKRPALIPTEEEVSEQAIQAEMFRNALFFQQMHMLGCVEPAREQINLEHAIRIRDLLPLVSSNPFVPSGREMIYARGLQAGLTGDPLVAAHLLLPQIENSIRTLLSRQGQIVSKLDNNGMQDEFDLNRIFYDYWDDLVHLLGEDLAFDLRGLLVERFGSNLRNEGAHGLMDYAAFFSPQVSYVWWLTLRLCFIVLIATSPQEAQQQDQGDQSHKQESQQQNE